MLVSYFWIVGNQQIQEKGLQSLYDNARKWKKTKEITKASLREHAMPQKMTCRQALSLEMYR